MIKQHRTWTAKWIWPNDGRFTNSHVLFRRDFVAPAGVTRAECFIAVETFARVYLNGVELRRTTSLSYPGQQNYEVIDLRPHLREGVNQLAVLAWYMGIGCTSTWLKDPGVLCEIELDSPAGNTRIGSGADWPCLILPAWSGGLRSRQFNLDLMEILDFRKLPEGFPFPADMSAFKSPDVLPWAGVRMGFVELRDFPLPVSAGDAPLRVEAASLVRDASAEYAVPAVAVSNEDLLSNNKTYTAEIAPPPAGQAFTMVYYLGGYFIGYPHLVFDAPAGTVVDIAWIEVLTNGHFDIRNGQAWTADRYVLREGENTISPEEWKAGRYLQITLRNFARPIKLREVKFKVERYPLKRRVKLNSSNERLNRIVEIGLRSAELCMHDRIMDCPWRERRVWVSDVQRIALVNYYAFDDRQLIRHSLKQQARLQDPTGRVWVCIPLMEELPCQSMDWVRAIVEYQHYTGDTSLAADLADNVEWMHRWFMKCRDDGGLFFHPHRPVQNWMDNTLSPLMVKHQFETPFLASNLRYLIFLDDAAMLLRQAGQTQAADRATAERKSIAGKIAERFLDRRTGLFRECAKPEIEPAFSEFSTALAVCADLPNLDAAAYWDRYAAFVLAEPGKGIEPSPFGIYQSFEAMGRLGRTDEIVSTILQKWGPMVDAGSDTAWEWFNRPISACHGWSGVPIVALLRYVLKVDPRKAHRVRKEKIAGIDWMESVCDESL